MKKLKIECPICKKTFHGNYYDTCPCCDWMYAGWEPNAEDDFYSSENSTTIREAKENYAKGLNIWGEPLRIRRNDGTTEKCYICGTEFELDEHRDVCPRCRWKYTGWEEKLGEDGLCSANPITTIRQAKENYAKGLDIWGDPIKE